LKVKYLDIIEKQEDKETDISVVRFALYHLQESRNIDAFVMLLNEYETGLRTLGYVKELLGYYTSIDFENIGLDNEAMRARAQLEAIPES